MNGVCLLVAGVVRATLPGSEFTVAWEHSVEKTEWRERYVVEGAGLRLVEAAVSGMGAGMEPPAAATLRDGVWTWQPGTRLNELRLTRSGYARDYTLCSRDGCRGLAARIGPSDDGTVVTVRPCAPRPQSMRGERARGASL